MKTGLSIEEFVAEVKRRDETKKDYVASTNALRIFSDEDGSRLTFGTDSNGGLPVNDVAHAQIAARLGIPKQYYDRMRSEAPALLDGNVGHWFNTKPEKRLVRVLDGKVRAFLSDRYARIDNVDVLSAISQPLSYLKDEYGAYVASSEITDKRIYLKVVVPGIEAKIERGNHTFLPNGGDIVQAGFVIENSEVGHGAFSVKQMVFRLVCLNGLIRGETLRQTHVGARITGGGDDRLWSDATRRSEDHTILLAAKDVVKAAVDETRFQALVARLGETCNTPASVDPVATVTMLGKTHSLSEGEQGKVLACFVSDAAQNGLGLFGAVNAVTRASQNVTDYERATELEELGGKLLDTTPSEWRKLAGIVS